VDRSLSSGRFPSLRAATRRGGSDATIVGIGENADGLEPR
jgi:hypothetical protein